MLHVLKLCYLKTELFFTVAVWHHLHGLGPKATITRDVDEAIVEKYKEEVTEKQKGIQIDTSFIYFVLFKRKI